MANFEKNYKLRGGDLEVKVSSVNTTLCEVGDEKKVEGKRTKCVTLYYVSPELGKSYGKTIYEEDNKKFYTAAVHALNLDRSIREEKTNGLDTEYLEEVRPIVEALQQAKFYVHDITFGNGLKFCRYKDILTKDEASKKSTLSVSELKTTPFDMLDRESPTGIRTTNQIVAKTTYKMVDSKLIDEDKILGEVKRFGALLEDAKIEELNKSLEA